MIIVNVLSIPHDEPAEGHHGGESANGVGDGLGQSEGDVRHAEERGADAGHEQGRDERDEIGLAALCEIDGGGP